MRIYIIEDDITVISILEDIVEQNELGTICGDTADAPPDLEGILAADPDLVLVDLLMPGKDGIQVVRELKEGGSRAKFIMISQVSAKELIARAYSAGVEYFTPANSGMGAESCHIWNNYLRGVDSTIQAMVQLTQGLEELDRPVVLVLFGDHKPWGGNGNSAYADMGLTFDLGTLQGFYDYYATPYLIWANSAAKEVQGSDFTGEGGDFSPCFLMPKVFDLCGWTGPGFMQLARQVREITPLVHERGLYLSDGQITDALPQGQQDFVDRFLWAEYWRENNGR